MINVNVEHCAAILICGIAGIAGITSGYADAGFVLLGGILGYAFQNGKKILSK